MGSLLIVDDQDVVRQGIRKMVDEFDLDLSPVYEAGDGVEALILAKRHRPDIVLADIMMPEMDGLAFIEQLRSAGVPSRVVILSAHSEFEFARKAILLKVDSYILKPVTRKELYLTLSNLLDAGRSALPGGRRKYEQRLFHEFLCGRDALYNAEALFATPAGKPASPLYQVVLLQADGFQSPAQLEAAAHVLGAHGNSMALLARDDLAVCVLNLDNAAGALAAEAAPAGMRLGVSPVAAGAGQLPELYRQALQSLQTDRGGPDTLPEQDLEALLRCFESDDPAALGAALEKLFFHAGTTGRGLDALKAEFKDIVERLHHRTADRQGVQQFQQDMDAASDFFSLRALVKVELERLHAQCRLPQEPEVVSPVIREVLQYIGDNYQREMSLTYIANWQNVNYNYLSSLFAKVMGVPFTDYLLQFRLDRAMALFKAGGRRVQEVSAMVGFRDAKYFCRAFKKRFRCTPSDVVAQKSGL